MMDEMDKVDGVERKLLFSLVLPGPAAKKSKGKGSKRG